MNKKYIKRQIVLHKLGIPMDENLKEYYDYFHQTIGNINDLKKLKYDGSPDNIIWFKDDEMILAYYIKDELFRVDYTLIWKKFRKEYRLGYSDNNEVLSSLLEESFNLKTKMIDVL